MVEGIIGRKVGMTQLFEPDGRVVPVTVIEAGPCVVVQRKTRERDGYDAVQLGYADTTEKRTRKPQRGHFAKAGTGPKRFVREERLDAAATVEIGDTVTAERVV